MRLPIVLVLSRLLMKPPTNPNAKPPINRYIYSYSIGIPAYIYTGILPLKTVCYTGLLDKKIYNPYYCHLVFGKWSPKPCICLTSEVKTCEKLKLQHNIWFYITYKVFKSLISWDKMTIAKRYRHTYRLTNPSIESTFTH